MTIKKYAGDKITGLSSDTKPTAIPDGATFYETDTKKVYILTGGSWLETVANNTSFVGSVSAANVVSNAQLTANLANYTTTTALTNNLANYQTTAGLASNVATLAANSATYLGGNTASNLRTYSEQKADNAYSNAVSYVDGKSYVNTSQLSSNLSNYAQLSGATFTGNVSANNANTTYDLTVGRNLTVTGNLTILGASTVLQGNAITFSDNMLYLNQGVLATITGASGNGTYVDFTANNNFQVGWDVFVSGVTPSSYNGNYQNIFSANSTHFTVANTNTDTYVSGGTARGKSDQNPDLGLAAGYNDGTYHHTGLFRDASDGFWKVFDNYAPEPDAAVNIDTSNLTFHTANFWANTIQVGNTSVYSTINTTSFDGTANNTNFVGAVSAANVVSNAQLSGNLANYQTTAGLSANVATLTANNANFVKANNGITSNSFGVFVTQGTGTVVNATGVHVNATYIGTLTANNTSFVGSVSAANVVSNAQLSANLGNYQTTAGLSANVATLTANNSTYLNGQLASYYTNATNITTGTLPYSQIPANVLNTTASFTINGVYTYNANVILGSGLSANGGFGTAGQVLTSNGTATYWSTVSGGSGSVNLDSTYAWNNNHTWSSAANLIFGTGSVADTRFYVNTYWTTDTSTTNIQVDSRDNNTALTAIRNRYGIYSSLNNRSQNKNADGVTTYNSNYRAVVGDVVSGSSSSGGNAFASEIIGGNFRSYNYANGSAANGVNSALGTRNQAFSYGTGTILNAYGSQNQVFIGNSTATGNITTAYGVYSEVQSNAAATIATGYLYYGQHTGSTTTNKFGVYVTGESNNYFSSNVRIQGATYMVGNVGIGVNAPTDTQLQSSITWTSDLSLWNQYNGTTDSNTAMTAARIKYGFQSSFSNRNQNKSSDGLTTYSATYRAVDGRVFNGSTSTGGDAYADELQGGSFRAYNYANGATSNTVSNLRGVYSEAMSYGSGVTSFGWGSYSRVGIGNSSATGNITTGYAVAARVESNTSATIADGYLFHGRHDGSTTTNKWGVYLLNETKSYFSGNVGIGNTVPTDKLSVNGTTYLGANLTLTSVLIANGGAGTAGQVLTSNGTTGSPYWSTASGGSVNVNATYAWTNTHTYSVGADAISFTNATSNWISWNTAGLAAPSVTTRSAGTKIVLYPSLSATTVDYAIGGETSHLWFSAGSSVAGFKWYANTTNIMTANTTGLTVSGDVSIGGALTANGSQGSGGQVLTAATLGNTYWSTLSLFNNITIQTFTSGTGASYTAPGDLKYAIVFATGGGGGGGGSDVADTGAGAGGAGGGAGATVIGVFTAAQMSGATYTVGAGGNAGAATNGTSGTAGGTTTFTPSGGATALSAGGGALGTGTGAGFTVGGSVAGGAGGTGTGGSIQIEGGDGDYGVGDDIGEMGIGGLGGSSYWGGGGYGGKAQGATNVAGAAGAAYGSGGGGGGTIDSQTGANGGAGKAGVVMVIEFRG